MIVLNDRVHTLMIDTGAKVQVWDLMRRMFMHPCLREDLEGADGEQGGGESTVSGESVSKSGVEVWVWVGRSTVRERCWRSCKSTLFSFVVLTLCVGCHTHAHTSTCPLAVAYTCAWHHAALVTPIVVSPPHACTCVCSPYVATATQRAPHYAWGSPSMGPVPA